MATIDVKNMSIALFQKTARELKQRIVKILMIKNKVATGKLVKSIDVITGSKGGDYFIDLLMEDYGIFVNNGRRAGGKMPPDAPIREWARIKGIPEAAVFPIRRAIAINGIPPVYFIEQAVKDIEIDFEEDINDFWNNEFGDEIARQIKNAYK